MEDRKKLIIVVMILSVFVFIVGVSSFYVQTQIETGNVCGCSIPITLFIPFLASVGLFIGTMIYYLLIPARPDGRIDRNVILGLFAHDERKVVSYLIEKNGSALQSAIVSGTGLSKVKVFRILERLSSKGITSKSPHGKTNMISLNKDLSKSVK
ncbi:MAG: hypothetical protein J7K54_01310 [Candidatus Aenigmarchaeota archaeon]|nr:hypothetical protein [Candidatus Aenigmarchaeota archaeon]